MNILLLGSGGREHALALKMSQSPLCKQLFIAPGNAGTAQCGQNINMGVSDFQQIKTFCLENAIDLVVPGSEEALVNGIYDFFKEDVSLQHIPVMGPSREGAQLEGSKAYAKLFMERHQIPTAAYREFNEQNYEEGVAYIQQHSLPIVLKADGLAAGKGVVIAFSQEEALTEFEQMIKASKFGDASKKVVIEQFLTGIELSVFVLTDGHSYQILPEAKDYKRIGEGDKGLNTGGMGAVSPVPFADAVFMKKVEDKVIKPTIDGLSKEGIVYNGFVFFGLINVDGEPLVIEYNCRMGDPETEVVMPRLKNDLLELFQATISGKLKEQTIYVDERAASTVMLVSKGYPEAYEKNKVITGIPAPTADQVVFHAGTKAEGGNVLTNGGRVLAITSLAGSLSQALSHSVQTAEKIQFDGKVYRRDIGYEFI
ncbi:phosphoribosylamine--glycine ligase [Chitinophaga terrae (ex Kim and Jung 2007)]|jgi:phosphoribosylamine--glycine ligase|uniref:phosphoribosylamine--glycine ligase n=1 Tax=Chitinophaga terrae (ex Kim and Jung 2007) TaxID=408074 RepID=UPI002784FECE|nr:phosphoribosylamine--glycine ligase [Chitinophaga terrae (ex Kim and Jung 2007)]MDQ0105263.1 phosphoribosylamine--glycine ligase [Chitinophaga terrae (ex Kim and Jung 2007)]